MKLCDNIEVNGYLILAIKKNPRWPPFSKWPPFKFFEKFKFCPSVLKIGILGKSGMLILNMKSKFFSDFRFFGKWPPKSSIFGHFVRTTPRTTFDR